MMIGCSILSGGNQIRRCISSTATGILNTVTRHLSVAHTTSLKGSLGTWDLGLGSWVLGLGDWRLDTGDWILDTGYWILDMILGW